MSEMVERVAEATAKSDGFKSLVSVPREKREGYERRARAAIEAMEVPTEYMVEAVGTWPDGPPADHVYTTMIRAALTARNAWTS